MVAAYVMLPSIHLEFSSASGSEKLDVTFIFCSFIYLSSLVYVFDLDLHLGLCMLQYISRIG